MKLYPGCVRKLSVGRIQITHTDYIPLQVCVILWWVWQLGDQTCSHQLIAFPKYKICIKLLVQAFFFFFLVCNIFTGSSHRFVEGLVEGAGFVVSPLVINIFIRLKSITPKYSCWFLFALFDEMYEQGQKGYSTTWFINITGNSSSIHFCRYESTQGKKILISVIPCHFFGGWLYNSPVVIKWFTGFK